ncbi:Hypothetical predicted protein [Mytilus galloprovincialis]|uniref:Phorbol-ester/DAG-type domain-containing protein n=1 Tax=Mytilus galloprovincialis TaxID=29158 RepID=A0A8B6DWV9_MYTGA|nr:Hypothetical predicted protein [Mytilus galloprovincialis]
MLEEQLTNCPSCDKSLDMSKISCTECNQQFHQRCIDSATDVCFACIGKNHQLASNANIAVSASSEPNIAPSHAVRYKVIRFVLRKVENELDKLNVTANHIDKNVRAENLDGLPTHSVIDERPQETNATNNITSAIGQSCTNVQINTTEIDNQKVSNPKEGQQPRKRPVSRLVNVKGPPRLRYCLPPNILSGHPMYLNATPTAPSVRFNAAPTGHLNATPTVDSNAVGESHKAESEQLNGIGKSVDDRDPITPVQMPRGYGGVELYGEKRWIA